MKAGPEAQRMLDRLKERVESGKLKEEQAKKTIDAVAEGIVQAKHILKSEVNLFKLSPKEIGDLTNAWKAWGKEGIFKGDKHAELRKKLQDLWSNPESKIQDDRLKRYARQMWRTEIVHFVIDEIKDTKELTPQQRNDVMEEVMESQRVTDNEDDPIEALTGAMHLDPAIKERSVRLALAERMDASEHKDIAIVHIQKVNPALKIKSLRVVVGGELVDIPVEIAGALRFKKLIKEGDMRIYAQMQNGCRGNLTIIDFEKKEVVPPPPKKDDKDVVPPPPPKKGDEDVIDPPPPPPEIVPPPPIEPEERSGLTAPGQGEHLAADDREPFARVAPTANQFDERYSKDFASRIVMENFRKNAMDGVLDSLEAVPEGARPTVLKEFFKVLGKERPEELPNAMQELINILAANKDAYAVQLQKAIQENIKNASTSAEKELWQVQEQMILLRLGKHPALSSAHSEPHKVMEELYLNMKKINPDDLPAGLKEMREDFLSGIENSLRQTIALDMVQSSLQTLQGTFTEWTDTMNLEDSLEELQEMDDETLKANLKNEWLRINDSDAEVFIASSHVLESLRLLITYQYPQDLKAGRKIENPVKHYFDILEGANGDVAIILPPGVTATAHNPRKKDPKVTWSSGFIYTRDLFVDGKSEFNLFKKYQSGAEKMGDDSILNFWKGKKGAFFSGKGGLIEGSEAVFRAQDIMNANRGGDLQEKDKIGSFERLQLTKVVDLFYQGNFDEARALAIEALGLKISVPDKAAVEAKVNKIYKEEVDKVAKAEAKILIALESEGMTAAEFMKLQKSRPDLAKYKDLLDYVKSKSRSLLEERAFIALAGESAKALKPDASWTQFEKLNLDALNRLLNGEGTLLGLTAEGRTKVQDLAEMGIEIATVELLTGGLGAAAGALVGVARGGSAAVRLTAAGSRTLPFSRVMGTQRFAARGAARVRQAFLRRMSPTGSIRKGARALQNTSQRFVRGEKLRHRIAQPLLHGAVFAEGMALMHGDYVNPLTPHGAYEIAMMGVTFGALGKIQQLTRGQTIGAQVHQGTRAAGWAETAGLGGRQITWIGDKMHSLAHRGRLGSAAATGIEMGAEIGGFYWISDWQESLGVSAHELTNGFVGMSNNERLAMMETNAFDKFVNIAAPVVMLRTWRSAIPKQAQSQQGPVRPSMRINLLGNSSQRPTESSTQPPSQPPTQPPSQRPTTRPPQPSNIPTTRTVPPPGATSSTRPTTRPTQVTQRASNTPTEPTVQLPYPDPVFETGAQQKVSHLKKSAGQNVGNNSDRNQNANSGRDVYQAGRDIVIKEGGKKAKKEAKKLRKKLKKLKREREAETEIESQPVEYSTEIIRDTAIDSGTPTQVPTQAPTQVPTQVTTQSPTQVPTQPPTPAPIPSVPIVPPAPKGSPKATPPRRPPLKPLPKRAAPEAAPSNTFTRKQVLEKIGESLERGQSTATLPDGSKIDLKRVFDSKLRDKTLREVFDGLSPPEKQALLSAKTKNTLLDIVVDRAMLLNGMTIRYRSSEAAKEHSKREEFDALRTDYTLKLSDNELRALPKRSTQTSRAGDGNGEIKSSARPTRKPNKKPEAEA